MSIEGKTEIISRFLGSFLILVSIILGMCLSFLIFSNLLISLNLLLITVPPFMLSILLKVEQDFIIKHAPKFLFLLLLEIIVLNSIIFVFYSISLALVTVLISSSNILLIICWHFSLSIHKKNKIIFLICGICYFFVFLPLLLNSIPLTHLFIYNLILFLIVSLGLFLIIAAELIMRKKGWLKYI
jgi:hypothetical protein